MTTNLFIKNIVGNEATDLHRWHSERIRSSDLFVVERAKDEFTQMASRNTLLGVKDERGVWGGAIFFREKPDSFELAGLVVHDDLRKIGLGEALASVGFFYLIGLYAELFPDKDLVATVDIDNPEAPTRLLSRCGFRVTNEYTIVSATAANPNRTKSLARYSLVDYERLIPVAERLASWKGDLKAPYQLCLNFTPSLTFRDLSEAIGAFSRY